MDKKHRPLKRNEVPVTFGMLTSVREELKSEIRAVKSQVKGLESRLDSRLEKVQAEIHRIALMVEEQNARNIIVMNGLGSLFNRHQRVEDRQSAVENTVLRLK